VPSWARARLLVGVAGEDRGVGDEVSIHDVGEPSFRRRRASRFGVRTATIAIECAFRADRRITDAIAIATQRDGQNHPRWSALHAGSSWGD